MESRTDLRFQTGAGDGSNPHNQHGICVVWTVRWPDLRGGLSVSDRERPSFTEVNGTMTLVEENVLLDANGRRKPFAERAYPWVPQLNARMVIRIWPVNCQNGPDSGTRRVYLGSHVLAGQRGAR